MLPSGLDIAVQERRAFMRLKVPDRKEIFVIDDEGGVLGEAREDLELPLFSDLRSEARGLAANGRYADWQVRVAVFGIRRILEAEAPFRGLKVREIQVHAKHNIHVQLENGLEIRVGKDYKEDLKKLRLVAPVMEGDVEELEYIDLRFRDVVAGKKEGKKRL